MRRASLIQFWARAGEATLPNVTSTATHNTGNRLTWRVIRLSLHRPVLFSGSDSRDAVGSCQKNQIFVLLFRNVNRAILTSTSTSGNDSNGHRRQNRVFTTRNFEPAAYSAFANSPCRHPVRGWHHNGTYEFREPGPDSCGKLKGCANAGRGTRRRHRLNSDFLQSP